MRNGTSAKRIYIIYTFGLRLKRRLGICRYAVSRLVASFDGPDATQSRLAIARRARNCSSSDFAPDDRAEWGFVVSHPFARKKANGWGTGAGCERRRSGMGSSWNEARVGE